MINGKLTAALAGAALALTPMAVQAQSRDAAPVDAESELGGSPIAAIVAAGIAALITVVLVTELDDDDDAISA